MKHIKLFPERRQTALDAVLHSVALSFVSCTTLIRHTAPYSMSNIQDAPCTLHYVLYNNHEAHCTLDYVLSNIHNAHSLHPAQQLGSKFHPVICPVQHSGSTLHPTLCPVHHSVRERLKKKLLNYPLFVDKPLSSDPLLLAIPALWSRVADFNPNYELLYGIGSPSQAGNPLYSTLLHVCSPRHKGHEDLT